MLNSIISEGFAGMQQSQKKMQQAAEDIVRAGLSPENSVNNRAGGGLAPATDMGTAEQALPPEQVVNAVTPGNDSNGSRDVATAMIEQRVQQHLFDASASVVKVGSQTLGSVIDALS